MTGQRIQQEAICYQWFKQRLLNASKPSISQRSQIKEDIVEPSVPAREFNLKAYAAITWHNDRASLGLEPRLADHRSQEATLPTAPPEQANYGPILYRFPHIARRWSKISKFIYSTCIQRHSKGDPVGISQRCFVLWKLEWWGYRAEESVMIRSAVSIQYRSVTDRHTVGRK